MASSWERLADITLGTAGDKLDSGTITAKEHLRVEIHTIPTGGTIKEDVTFNNDSGSNYARRRSNDNAAESTNVSRTELEVYGDNTTDRYLILDIINIANKEKLLIGEYHVNTVGVGNAPNRSNWVGKWANTSDQITRIEIDNGEGSGDYAVGSQMTIWGADDQTVTAKDKSTITDVPLGTRYEETDTKKIFQYKSSTGNTHTISNSSGSISTAGTKSSRSQEFGFRVNSGHALIGKKPTSITMQMFRASGLSSGVIKLAWRRASDTDGTGTALEDSDTVNNSTLSVGDYGGGNYNWGTVTFNFDGTNAIEAGDYFLSNATVATGNDIKCKFYNQNSEANIEMVEYPWNVQSGYEVTSTITYNEVGWKEKGTA